LAITSSYVLASSVDAQQTSRLNTLESVTGSFTLTSSFGAYTASNDSLNTTQNARLLSNEQKTGSFATTGSNAFSGSQTITGSLTATGTIVAQTLVVQTITSSVDFVSGSTRFGSTTGNTHEFTGSVLVSGSQTVNGALNGTSATFSSQLVVSNLTGSALDLLVLETGWNNPSGNKSIIWKDATNSLGRISVSYDASTGSTMRFGSLYNGGYQSSDLLTISSTGASTFSSSVGIAGSPTGTYGTLSVFGGVSIKNDNNAKLEIGRYSSGTPNSYIKIGANSNSLRFTNNTDAADVFTIENGGNVGVGTDSPTNYSGFTTLHINGKSGTAGGVLRLTSFNGNGGVNIYAQSEAIYFNTTTAVPFTWLTRDTERMRLTDSGSVGIGTTSPNNLLSVRGNLDLGATGLTYVGPTQYGGIVFPRGQILFSNTNTQNQFYLSSNAYTNVDGVFAYRNTGQPATYIGQDNGAIIIGVAGNGTANATVSFATALSILNNGNIGVGTSSPVSADVSAKILQVGNRLVIQNTIGTQFLLSTNAHYDANWKYIAAAKSQAIRGTGESGTIQFSLSPTGTAGGSLPNMDGSDVKMIILESGFVGIGTTNPSTKVHIDGSGEQTLTLKSASSNSVIYLQGPTRNWGIFAGSNSGKLTIKDETGNTEAINIVSGGIVTLPTLPAFYAWYNGGNSTRTTGAFTSFTSTRVNRGSHYNTANGRFTAPIAGVYEFVFSLLWRNDSGDTAAGEISIGVNGSNVGARGIAYSNSPSTVNYHAQTNAHVTLSLSAGDYVTGWIHSSGASIGNWYYGENLGYFSGKLLG
jgi:hypothetical protein